MTATLVASWLLTYLLHSTIFLCAALVVSRAMGGRSLAVQEILLRAALVGGVITSIVQIGFGISPLAGVVALNSAARIEMAAPVGFAEATAAVPFTPADTVAIHGNALDWATALIVFWGVGSILSLLGVLRSILDLKRLLQTRCFQPTGRLVENLATAMGLRKRVKLSTSKAIAVPFATGIRQPEICCPERVEELAREHRTSLFAHELAHLVRCDPAWQLLYRLGEALFVLQPLNRLVRYRLEEIAEHLTDERAVACTGDRLGLARCLVVVAHWGLSSGIGLPATAFAAGPRLDRRVQRLISGATGGRLGTRWAFAIIVSLVIGAATILPTVGAVQAHAESTGSPTVAPTTWSILAEESGSGFVVADTKTWSILNHRPAEAPPVPALPAAPSEAAAPEPAHNLPAPSAVPRSTAAPSFDARPRTSAPPEPTRPEEPTQRDEPCLPDEPTLPDEPPVLTDKPAPSAPKDAPESPDTDDRLPDEQEAEARARRHSERELERAAQTEWQNAEARFRAEARALAREHQMSAEEIERRTAERLRDLETEREALREQIQVLRTETDLVFREEVRAARERSRALAQEANALEIESRNRAVQLTEEQREELRLKALEARAYAEAQRQETKREMMERARELSEKARQIEAEAERRALEEMMKQEKPQ